MSKTVTAAVPLVHTIAVLRERIRGWRASGESVALVPTMGALHAGHLSLVDEARKRAVRVVVTIFVNPTQFGPTEDYAKYPRTLASDLVKLAEAETDLCFAPAADEMYPQGFATTVNVEGPAKADLEDRFRPEHFCGVATIVAKLLNQAQADVAVFGEKDYQQLLVIRRLARDLDIATQILSGPTLREPDGLAMSSRNVYLSARERAVAPTLYRELQICARSIAGGAPIDCAVAAARDAVAAAGFIIDYLEARHAETLARVESAWAEPLRLLVAARIGATRLIDNLAVGADHA
jgi:pantoate--beta-alanine ligase